VRLRRLRSSAREAAGTTGATTEVVWWCDTLLRLPSARAFHVGRTARSFDWMARA
jgi:hypothetical protein